MIHATIDSTELEKTMIIEINSQESHINLLSRQHAEDLSKINRLEIEIKKLKDYNKQQRMEKLNQY
jgi:hypothetical protein